VGPADVAFEAQHGAAELPVVASLAASDGTADTRPRLGEVVEGDARPADFGTEEAADVEAAPVDGRGDRGNRSLHDATGHRRQRVGHEVVAEAGLGRPTFDVVAGAVIAAHEPDPSGIENLTGNAGRELTVGADARGRGLHVDGRRSNPAWDAAADQYHAAWAGLERRLNIVGELVEHARRDERLQGQVAGLERRADADAGAAELAVDVADGNGARELLGWRQTGRVERIDLGFRPDEAGRRLDEPVVLQLELIAHRTQDRHAVCGERLIEEVGTGIVELDVVELGAHGEVGEEATAGDDEVGSGERNLEVGARQAGDTRGE